MAKGRGRPRKSREQKLKDAFERTAPAQYILDRRRLFGGIATAPKGGEIDSEVCDAIGQLCALGLLDGHGHDPVELRDKGRFWGQAYAMLMEQLDANTAGWDMPVDTSIMERFVGGGPMTGWRMLFDKMDENLPSYERTILLSLLVDPLIGHGDTVDWAQSLIDEALLQRGRVPAAMTFPTLEDRHRLEACIRGLCVLVDGSLPARWAA
jgi:hypothetical protein